jgi:hypothetical protein
MEKIEVDKKELTSLLQETGDSIADLFEQYLKGNWKDDHNHDVGMNTSMIKLKKILVELMEYRYLNLNYSDPYDKDN